MVFISSLAFGYILRNAATTSTSATHGMEKRLNEWYTRSLSEEKRNARFEPVPPIFYPEVDHSIYSEPTSPSFINQ